MRHLERTHRVNIDWLHEAGQMEDVVLSYEGSSRQASDIFTKCFTNPDKWIHATELIGVFPVEVFEAIEKGEKFSVPPQVAIPVN